MNLNYLRVSGINTFNLIASSPKEILLENELLADLI